MNRLPRACTFLVLALLTSAARVLAAPVIHVNQIAFDARGPKQAVVECDPASLAPTEFVLIEQSSGREVFHAALERPVIVEDWSATRRFARADFSAFAGEGAFQLGVGSAEQRVLSVPFAIGDRALARAVVGAIIDYYHHQRATTPGELEADRKMRLFGSDKTVDIHGGWCDASGDVSKYFSHLAYANFMSPQQIPLVVWSMASADAAMPRLLDDWKLREPLRAEALYGADYLRRALSDDGYFYMVVFSYFKKDPAARRIVGLRADSVTTSEYECAFREGAGLAIAALARISQWKKDGDFTAAQYLDGAKRAFAHLLVNNLKYDDDGNENIIDDYCALLAGTELWLATGEDLYRDQARQRARRLAERQTPDGYFIADGGNRPFWHASDAGLPVVALARYLDREQDPALRRQALDVIRRNLDYQLRVTQAVPNPFGYARQTFRFRDRMQDGFFIPHENETGWWWQGENARLGSLATAALVGGRLTHPDRAPWGVQPPLARYAEQQLSWILGSNPYSMCFMYQFGRNNVPYMSSNYGHGSARGGISNGITGKDGSPDGRGIDFKPHANGNEWRWTEQWLPHAAWFLQALAATARPVGDN